MATTMEGFDQVVVGGASCTSEVIIIFIAFTVSFFFLPWRIGVGGREVPHLSSMSI